MRLLAQEPPHLWRRAVDDLIKRIGDRVSQSHASNLEFTLTSRGGGPLFQEGYLSSSLHGKPRKKLTGRPVPKGRVREAELYVPMLVRSASPADY